MADVEKPSAGSWTEHYPELGTDLVSYEDSISREFYELESEAIFKRAWLNVGRVEQLPRNGSYFTREIAVAKTSVIVVRGMDGELRAFHDIAVPGDSSEDITTTQDVRFAMKDGRVYKSD